MQGWIDSDPIHMCSSALALSPVSPISCTCSWKDQGDWGQGYLCILKFMSGHVRDLAKFFWKFFALLKLNATQHSLTQGHWQFHNHGQKLSHGASPNSRAADILPTLQVHRNQSCTHFSILRPGRPQDGQLNHQHHLWGLRNLKSAAQPHLERL